MSKGPCGSIHFKGMTSENCPVCTKIERNILLKFAVDATAVIICVKERLKDSRHSEPDHCIHMNVHTEAASKIVRSDLAQSFLRESERIKKEARQ